MVGICLMIVGKFNASMNTQKIRIFGKSKLKKEKFLFVQTENICLQTKVEYACYQTKQLILNRLPLLKEKIESMVFNLVTENFSQVQSKVAAEFITLLLT